MVTQPAYLKNLKEYARSRSRTLEDLTAAVKDLSAESDRGAIILAATSIEDFLGDKIAEFLPGLLHDEAAKRKMFDPDGQIGSFARKIQMAYALGIIDNDYRKKIDLVREIRNACAHSRKPISLNIPELRIACEAVMPDMMPSLQGVDLTTFRREFVQKCMFIVHYIGTGEKVEGTLAVRLHFDRLIEQLPRKNSS